MNVFDQNKMVGFKIKNVEETNQIVKQSFGAKSYSGAVLQNTDHTLAFITDGKCNYYFSDKNVITAQKNDIVFYPEEKLCKAETTPNYQSYVINFEAQNGFINSPGHFSPENSEKYLLLFKDTAHLFNLKKSGYMLMIKSNFLKILFNINSNSQKNNKIAHITEYIKENLSNYQLSVEKIAKKLNISSTHLRKIVIEATGMSPLKYIKSIKIDYAKKRLIEKDITIAQISLECGFLDTSYFCKEFKKHTDMSPLMFRKNNCEKQSKKR